MSNLLNDANLQGYWRLEQNYEDSGPNGYDLTTIGGSPNNVTGKFGYAKEFIRTDGDNAEIADGSCPNLEISGSQTWCCWVKTDSTNDPQAVLQKLGGGSPKEIFLSSRYPVFSLPGLSGTSSIASSTQLSTGTWYHVVGRYDSATSRLSIFVNGSENYVTASGSATDSNGSFGLSHQSMPGTYGITGSIDDVAIFNRALTNAEIAELYNSGTGTELNDLNCAVISNVSSVSNIQTLIA